MKTIIIESSSPLSWYFLADSALVNAGKPFFIPEFADEFEAFLAPTVRITRIGKSIASRFAGRYYEEIAPAVHFRASALRKSLLEAGLPTDPSHSFDRAMTVGQFMPASLIAEGKPLKLNLYKASDLNRLNPFTVECLTAGFNEKFDNMLEAVSKSNTIKMGDYLVAEMSEPLKIEIGDTLTVTHGEDTLLTIHIK